MRAARPVDYERLSGLLKQLNPKDPDLFEMGPRVFQEILESRYFHLIVGEVDESVLGSCYLNVVPNLTRGGRPYAVIENVIVDGSCRNLGLGEALMRRALDIAREKGCYKVMLMTGRADESVHAFYRKCGFNSDQKRAYICRFD